MTDSVGSSPELLSGPDRIEYWPTIGRTVRMGTPSALAVSDVERVRTALRGRDAGRARSYVDHVHNLALWMNASWIEWSLTWATFIEERTSANEAARLNELTYRMWLEGVTTSRARNVEEAEAVELAARLLSSVARGAEDLAEFRSAQRMGEPERIRALHEGPRASHLEVTTALEAGRYADAQQAFERYVRQSRSRHDLLASFMWAYPMLVAREFGQVVAEEGIRRSLELCSWFEDLWKMVPELDAASLTALLAEELRAHWSGPGREGSVRIVEERDRFRLIFEPCGSGQAMRQDEARGWSTGFGLFAHDRRDMGPCGSGARILRALRCERARVSGQIGPPSVDDRFRPRSVETLRVDHSQGPFGVELRVEPVAARVCLLSTIGGPPRGASETGVARA